MNRAPVSYADAIKNLILFVADVSKDHPDPKIREKGSELVADFVLAALLGMKPKTLEELEAENPDGFRNPE